MKNIITFFFFFWIYQTHWYQWNTKVIWITNKKCIVSKQQFLFHCSCHFCLCSNCSLNSSNYSFLCSNYSSRKPSTPSTLAITHIYATAVFINLQPLLALQQSPYESSLSATEHPHVDSFCTKSGNHISDGRMYRL